MAPTAVDLSWWTICVSRHLHRRQLPTIPLLTRRLNIRFDVEDIIHHITPYLTHHDLRSLLQAARCCHDPARKALFNEITVCIPVTSTNYLGTATFLEETKNKRVRGYIRSLVIRGPSITSTEACDVDGLIRLSRKLPVLRDVTLFCLLWRASIPSIPRPPPLNLRSFRLAFVGIEPDVIQASPFELLDRMTVCEAVIITACNIDALLHFDRRHRRLPEVAQFGISAMERDPVLHGRIFPVVSPFPFFNMTCLHTNNLNVVTMDALTLSIEAGAFTRLEDLDLHFARILDEAGFTRCKILAAGIAGLPSVRRFRVSHPVNVTYEFLSHGDRRRCWDLRALELMAIAAPSSTVDLDIILRFLPTEPNFHGLIIDAVHWDEIVNSLGTTLADMDCFVTTVTLTNGEFLMEWTPDLSRKLEVAFEEWGFVKQYDSGTSDIAFVPGF